MASSEEHMRATLIDLMRSAQEAAKAILKHPGAFASVTMTAPANGDVEIVWEIGVEVMNASKGDSGQGATWSSRDLWGRGGSLDEALNDARAATQPQVRPPWKVQ